MKYCVVDSCEWTYPDVHSYETGDMSICQTALSGSLATFQIHVWDVACAVLVRAENLCADFYEEIPIPVEDNPNFEKEVLPSSRLKRAPFWVNDCLCPWKGQAMPRRGSVGIYGTISVPTDARGTVTGTILLTAGEETASIPVTLSVCSGKLPEETLQIAMGYSPYNAAKWHGLLEKPELAEEMDTRYLQLLRRQHQNRLYVDSPQITDVGPNVYWFGPTSVIWGESTYNLF